MHAADLMTHRARLTPDREALLDLHTGLRYTYRQLNERANRAANLLRELGVGHGDHISILAQNGVVYVDLLYGVAKIGAVLAPLNWRLVARELEYIINDCAPKVLLVGPGYVDLWAELSELAAVKPVVLTLEDGAIPGTKAYEALLEAASPAEPDRPAELDPHGEDTHCILYTSGTTGKPKGALLPQRQVYGNCVNTVVSWGLTEHDVSPILTPLFHAGGLFAFLTPLLFVGGRVLLGRTFDPADSLRLIVEEKCTVILGVPTLFQMWKETDYFDEADFSHVHFFISGGAPCPPSLMDEWRSEKGVVFRQGYGLTEVGTNCFSMTDEDSVPRTGYVGRPIFNTEMKLINPETGETVPHNTPGELLIKGATVCKGYLNRPEATAESLVDGWFHTGDTAEYDEDGFYRIIGRYKDMIKSGGENIYAAEVEAVFREHPAVADAALIGMPHEKWGEVGLMIVLCEKGQAVTEDDVKAHCGDRLARFKIPKKIIFAETLPYSPYGKVVKAVLREQYL